MIVVVTPKPGTTPPDMSQWALRNRYPWERLVVEDCSGIHNANVLTRDGQIFVSRGHQYAYAVFPELQTIEVVG